MRLSLFSIHHQRLWIMWIGLPSPQKASYSLGFPRYKSRTHESILLMEEIPNNHLGCIPNPVNNGINYQLQLVFTPDFWTINSMSRKIWARVDASRDPGKPTTHHLGFQESLCHPNELDKCIFKAPCVYVYIQYSLIHMFTWYSCMYVYIYTYIYICIHTHGTAVLTNRSAQESQLNLVTSNILETKNHY